MRYLVRHLPEIIILKYYLKWVELEYAQQHQEVQSQSPGDHLKKPF
jgi:hypothetical protein